MLDLLWLRLWWLIHILSWIWIFLKLKPIKTIQLGFSSVRPDFTTPASPGRNLRAQLTLEQAFAWNNLPTSNRRRSPHLDRTEKAGAKVKAKAQTRAQTKAKTRTKSRALNKTEAEPRAWPQADPELKPELKPRPKPGPGLKTRPGPELTTEPKPERKPRLGAKPQIVSPQV